DIYSVSSGQTINGSNNVLINGTKIGNYNGTQDLVGEVTFANPSSNDFRLAVNDTRAKDKGSVLSGIPLVDMDGNPVPFGSLPDIGAYEFIAGTTGGDNVNLNLKILLEGPFENGVMKTDINQANGLPLT